MMKICIVTLFYNPAGGGIPRYVDNLSRSFARLNHEVDILTVSYDNKDEIYKLENNLKLYKLKSLNIFGKHPKECKEKSKEFLNFMEEYIKKRKVDIIVTQNLHAAISSINHILVLNNLAIQKKIPITLTIHAFPEEPSAQLKIALAKNLFWDKIVCVSSSVAERFYNEGIDIDKIKVIHPGININQFKPNLGKKWLRSRVEGLLTKDIVIMHASRTDADNIIEEKGIKTLLKAFSFISERQKNIKLLIASAPVAPPFIEDKNKTIEKIKNLTKLYNIQDKVKIATFAPENMPLVYNGCDIFVMASKLESFGLVYAEAMACGIPVIGTNVGGIPEVITHGKCGYIIEPDNAVELSKYIEMLIETPKLRKKMGRNGIKIVNSKFNVDKISAKRIGTYNSLIYYKK